METELLRCLKKAGLDAGIGPEEEKEFSHELYACRYTEGVIRCLACKSEKVYQLADMRYRCGRCKYTYGAFTGTWLGLARISLTAWLSLLRAFTDNLTARQAVQLSGVSFPTVLRVFHIIRQAIAITEEPLLMDGSLARAKNLPHKSGKDDLAIRVPVFGLTEHSQAIEIILLPEMEIAELLRQPVRIVKKGGLIYTDAFMYHDALLAYVAASEANELDKQALFTRGTVYVDRSGGFIPFLRQSLNKYHRIEQEKFPFYLYEIKCRYQNNNPLFERLLSVLNRPVPEV